LFSLIFSSLRAQSKDEAQKGHALMLTEKEEKVRDAIKMFIFYVIVCIVPATFLASGSFDYPHTNLGFLLMWIILFAVIILMHVVLFLPYALVYILVYIGYKIAGKEIPYESEASWTEKALAWVVFIIALSLLFSTSDYLSYILEVSEEYVYKNTWQYW